MTYNPRYLKIKKILRYIVSSHLLVFDEYDIDILAEHLYLFGYDDTCKDIKPILTYANKECENEKENY